MKSNQRKVAVLGCGPAGLMAAHAAEQAGCRVRIFSKGDKSAIPGAQYLHRRILGITPDEFDLEVDFIKFGTREVYAEKAYGRPDPPTCSWDNFDKGLVQGWSLRKAYDKLWEKYKDRVEPQAIDPVFVRRLIAAGVFVISSIPAQVICHSVGHVFLSEAHWICPTNGMVVPPDTIIYNGYPIEYPQDGPIDADEGDETPTVNWWHRGSNIDGQSYLEAGHAREDGVPVTKPQSTTCNCWGNRVMRVGRYGRWERDVLTDSAYWDVRDLLS